MVRRTLKWFYYFFRLFKCPHYWYIHERTNVYGSSDTSKLPVRVDYVLRCRRCGSLKKFSS